MSYDTTHIVSRVSAYGVVFGPIVHVCGDDDDARSVAAELRSHEAPSATWRAFKLTPLDD